QQVTQKALEGLPQISFNYLGQLGDQSNGSNAADWQIIAEDSGQMVANENSDSLLLNINGAVQRGVLHFTIASRTTDLLSDNFATRFKKALINVIEEAKLKAQRGSIMTLSDLNDAFLSVHEKAKGNLIFFLSPGGGGAESYLTYLVPQLKDRKIIIFNNLYHEGDSKNDNVQNYYTFETLATQYIRYIKKIQPVGPYELFGWSFGGVLAFEIARQLEMNCNKISKITLIDSRFSMKKVINNLSKKFPSFNKKQTQEDINTKYECNMRMYFTNAEIVLFKFSKIDKMNEQYEAKHLHENATEDEIRNETLFYKNIEILADYYNKTIDNHIKDYVSCNTMKIIPLTSTHDTWIGNCEDVSLVVKSIGSDSIT
ncbi:MAG: hypothetical protein KAH18_07410, partial [Psychromonas sp.]|nr:hypothetical protein [Psychromonas sp.]